MKTILVVEDDKLLGSVLKQRLEKENFSVLLARSVKKAEELITNNPVSLIYLDVLLPGEKDGFDFLRWVKNQEDYKHIPVLVVSNFGELERMDEATELGAADYLLKVVVNLDKLTETIRDRLLEQPSPVQE